MEIVYWQRLEDILNRDNEAQKDIAIKYPDEMVRWNILRKRNGRFCPMARGILKLLIAYEKDNTQFFKNIEDGQWTKMNWT